MKVVRDSILVKLPEKETTSAGGIVLVGKEEDTVKPMWVEVVATGPDVSSIEAGNWVIAAIDRKSNDRFEEGDERYAKLSLTSVFAVGMTESDVKEFSLNVLDNDVLVSDMSFGEQKTTSGIVISSDNGKTHGIHPRWAKVFKIGPKQNSVNEGQWILVEHGRWTRGYVLEDGTVVRKIDVKSMIAVSDEMPSDLQLGEEYGSQSSNIKPEDFVK